MKTRKLIVASFLCSVASMTTLMACGSKTNKSDMEENNKEVSLTWIEDKPGPSVNDCGLFPEVPDSIWKALGLENGVPSSMSCFLVQTDGKNILFDTGLGAPFSQLPSKLSEKGLTPDSIGYIFLTHLHGDHIGGMMKDGEIVFPNAQVYVNRTEAEAWKNMPDGKGDQATAILDAYKDRLHQFEAGDTLDCEIISIPAYGHTPGHTVFQIDSILIAGDIMHGVALQTQYPEYCARYDMDKDAAIEARKRILQYAADNSLTLVGMHFPPATKE
ncbi:MAG: MBL fold metallo-hydrolase [Muribaculaceae bacterium]|nr:MBL fold metallo-hydrolase [Muribaculaceae bacterium]